MKNLEKYGVVPGMSMDYVMDRMESIIIRLEAELNELQAHNGEHGCGIHIAVDALKKAAHWPNYGDSAELIGLRAFAKQTLQQLGVAE